MTATLERIYAQVPFAGCRGLCYEACGVIIPRPGAERARMHAAMERAGVAIGWDEDFTCNALSSDKRCLIYHDRPLICRLYGVAEGLLCDYGCQPIPLVTRKRAEKLRALAERAN